MSVRSEVLLWAQRILAKKDPQPYQLLEIKPNTGIDDAQAAFHKIARMAHPDLHRTTLTPDELEQVTLAYSKVAGAYQEFRAQRMAPSKPRPPTADPVAAGASPTAADPGKPGASPGGPINPATAMNSKALLCFRKAELALKRGDVTTGMLQLKMAIAADPQSAFLRAALAEIQAEVGKKP